jgi:hypothetical protein
LEIEQPVACWDCASFDFHATLTRMLGPALIRHQVVQMCQSAKKCLLAATWMMEPLHHEEFPLDGVVGLIEQGTGHWYLRVCEYRIPAGLLLLEPLPHACTIGRSSRDGDVVGKAASPLAQRKHPPALPLACPVEQRVELGAPVLADRGRECRQFLRELDERVAQAVAQACSWEQRAHTLGGTVESVGQNPPDPIGWLLVDRHAFF